MADTVVYLLAALGLVALIVTVGSSRELLGPEFRMTTILAFLTTFGSILTQATLVVNIATTVQIAVVAVISIACVVAILAKPAGRDGASALSPSPGGRPLMRSGPVLAGLLLWADLFVTDVTKNAHLPVLYIAARATPAVLWCLLLLAVRTRPIQPKQFAFAISAAICVCAILLPVTPNRWGACHVNKCSPFGLLLAGPFSSGNYLGMQIAFMVLLVGFYYRGRTRAALLLLAAVLLVASDARTAIYSLLPGYTLLIASQLHARSRRTAAVTPIGRPRPHGERTEPGRLGLGTAIVIVAAAIGIGLRLIVTATPLGFSGRGRVWIEGYRALTGQRIFGLGTDRWQSLLKAGLVPDHFTHSQYLLDLFSGGAVGTVLFGVWMVTVLTQTMRRATAPLAAIAPCIGLLTMGCTEVVWNPLTFDGLAWLAIAVTLIASSTYTAHGPVAPVSSDPPGSSISGDPAQGAVADDPGRLILHGTA